MAHYIDVAKFGGVCRTGYIRVDHHLVTALVERWRQETHTFHLPIVGEATITLQGVEVIWGLCVDGQLVTLIHVPRSRDERKNMVQEILGFRPEDTDLRSGQLKMSILHR